MKKGFGIMEVLVAAVVLGFLIIALNTLQKGNRESIIRVRARDIASTIAQDVIDSISALGAASVKAEKREGICPPMPNGNLEDLCRVRGFDGKVGKVDVSYAITVDVIDDDNQKAKTENTVYMTKTGAPPLVVEHQFAKQVNVTVNWKFKNSNQSINVSSLVQ
jgi:Tfp pilus assembly protein PilV